MCHGCWEEEGSPVIDTPQVRDAARLVSELYEHAPAGGRCHIVTDDWNIEDHDVLWCVSREWSSDWESDAERDVALRVLEAFAALTVAERCSALALEDGFWVSREKQP